MRRLLEAPGQWRNDLQRGPHRNASRTVVEPAPRAAIESVSRSIPQSAAPRFRACKALQELARANGRLREDYWTGKVIALELTAPHSQMQTRGRRLPGAVLRRP